MTFTVLVAPSGFKESMDAEQAAHAIGDGVLRAVPDARVLLAPMADGGEGFTKALVKATGGEMRSRSGTGSDTPQPPVSSPKSTV